ncbi:S1 RNA-binding domain-containing protein [Ruminococcus bicirculans (ex Wegman et al. 2014)]|uniref:S1 RNA-binding domain-containing protein n=1 Tax=Ruminococcus bicirculans (ex Wegman et al. 2014) TaxID=1160721 RepID=UPI00241F75B4|nr:S1 RNA-binding domain-containing protein [Ruminococcus bicirculans (ex Wegman et al. 2014)]
MQLEVGKIYEGKVTGITKFGAFVELDKDTTGMVHISEVANTFVNEIKDHLTEGQTVKVKVLNLGDDGKISLSIKKAQPAPQDFAKNPPPVYNADSNSGNADFEDMLSKFKASSEERFSDLKKVIDNKRKSPSRRK